MNRSKLSAKFKSLPLRHRQRPQPSRLKSRPVLRRTPSENLQPALELSDLCLALREATEKLMEQRSAPALSKVNQLLEAASELSESCRKGAAHVGSSASPGRYQDLIPRKVIHDLRAIFGDDEHIFQSRTADAGFTFARLNGDRHSLFKNLRMVERPQAVDDGHVVTGARPEADAVADFTGKNFDFALLPPFARRRKMLRRVRRCLARFNFFDDGIDTLAHLFIPVFLFRRRLPAHNESPIGAAAVTHVSGPAIRPVDQIADLDDTARRMATTVEGHRSRAPSSRNSGFQAQFITGGEPERHQIGIFHPGFQILPHAKPHAVQHGGARFQTANLILIFYHPRFEHEIASVYNILDAGID